MGGLKDFAITQYMTEISSVKVVTLTLGHPVGTHTYNYAVNDEGKVS